MKTLILQLALLPDALRYGIIVAFCCLLGFLAAKLLQRPKAALFLIMAFLALAMLVENALRGDIKYWLAQRMLETQVANQRLPRLIFERHPEARVQFDAKTALLLQLNLDPEKTLVGSLFAMDDIAGAYLSAYLLTAPNEAVRSFLTQELENLQLLEAMPEACVRYYLGKPYLDTDSKFTVLVYAAQSEAKAELIEQAAAKPSPVETHLSAEEMVEALKAAYAARNHAPGLLADSGKIATLPPKEGCAAATAFFDALSGLDSDQAGALYKSLIAVRHNPSTKP